MFGFAKKIHKLEGETAAKCLADMMKDRGLSPQEFVMQADTLVLEALERVGIWEKLSNDAYKEIFKTERSYMNGVRNIYFRSKNITGMTEIIILELTSNRRLTDV